MSLSVCQDWNNGYCLLFDEECFNQCLLKPKFECDDCIHWDHLHHTCFNQKGCNYQKREKKL